MSASLLRSFSEEFLQGLYIMIEGTIILLSELTKPPINSASRRFFLLCSKEHGYQRPAAVCAYNTSLSNTSCFLLRLLAFIWESL